MLMLHPPSTDGYFCQQNQLSGGPESAQKISDPQPTLELNKGRLVAGQSTAADFSLSKGLWAVKDRKALRDKLQQILEHTQQNAGN